MHAPSSRARTPDLMSGRPLAALALAALLACTLAGCGPSTAQPAGGGMPPLTVGVVTVQPGAVPLTTELSGRLEAWRSAQVRARVTGIVNKRLFTEGALVKADQPLFQLDDAAYRATLASAEAGVARADAALAQAAAQLERNRPLAEAKAISPQDWLTVQTTHKQALADLASAKAAVVSARINVDYAGIKAPIAGRIGRAAVTEGALVGPTDATALALIQQTNPLYVNFTQSASELLRLRKAVDSGQLKRAGGAGAEVRVVLEDGSEYKLPGKLLFADPTVDVGTGQVSLRAELPNPDGTLLPGLFVKVRLVQATVDKGIRLPQQAVTRGATTDTVMVVGADGKPTPRVVKIGGAQGPYWVVLEGLQPGEQVMVDGFQKLMMTGGAPVKTVPWTPPGASAGGAMAAPAAGASAPAGAASGMAPAASR
ncbi:MAG: efflux transporter periplasmic adaptor subunit [Burkholderiales bacterium PBB5]|nr:MAG: efflux transporter periplasmic adaptor subunit [Burkholderiales bacterium PBB5]